MAAQDDGGPGRWARARLVKDDDGAGRRGARRHTAANDGNDGWRLCAHVTACAARRIERASGGASTRRKERQGVSAVNWGMEKGGWGAA